MERMRGIDWHAYASVVASGQMIYWLAQAARESRKEGKRKIIHIAVVADVDPSTIWRFESGHWPRDIDIILLAYAEELGIDPRAIWQRALELWSSSDQS